MPKVEERNGQISRNYVYFEGGNKLVASKDSWWISRKCSWNQLDWEGNSQPHGHMAHKSYNVIIAIAEAWWCI